MFSIQLEVNQGALQIVEHGVKGVSGVEDWWTKQSYMEYKGILLVFYEGTEGSWKGSSEEQRSEW